MKLFKGNKKVRVNKHELRLVFELAKTAKLKPQPFTSQQLKAIDYIDNKLKLVNKISNENIRKLINAIEK